MAITPQQKTAITAKLSVSLSTLTDDKLIELCLLYRSAPEALPTFPALLATEITRRFTAVEIAANDVMFSVIQNFSNQFSPELQYKEKLYQFVNALDREVWIAENVSFFEATLTVPSRVEWLLNDSVVFNAVFESPLASNKLFNSSVAMSVIAASTTAMSAVVASSVAMSAVAASSVALSAIVKSTAARNALMGSNTILQDNRVAIYNTVKASWTKQAGLVGSGAANFSIANINSAVISPDGFVFGSLGWVGTFTTAKVEVKHSNGAIAATAGTSSNPTTLANLDVVSFNGATFKATINTAQAYAELWIPPAI